MNTKQPIISSNLPLVETVIGVQFRRLSKMRITDYGLFWQGISGDYSDVQERERLEPVIETREFVYSEIGWRVISVAELPRVWYLGKRSENGQQLIQLQPDRYIHNWRREEGSSEKYPLYDWNFSKFQKGLSHFVDFVGSRGLGEFLPEQCELTYVNHIKLDKDAVCADAFKYCFPNLSPSVIGETFVGEEDRVSFSCSYWLDELKGRLHFEIQPGIHKKTSARIFNLTITMRGAPEMSVAGVADWISRAHKVVLKAFVSSTNEALHKEWGVCR